VGAGFGLMGEALTAGRTIPVSPKRLDFHRTVLDSRGIVAFPSASLGVPNAGLHC
jgi:hypothetical protein